MNQYTPKEEKAPVLLEELWKLLERAQSIFSQERVFRRGVALFLAELLALGRHTVTQLLRTLGATDVDWTAWYRLFSEPRFQEEQAGRLVLQESLEHVPAEQPYVVTIDALRFPRSGTHVAGSSWWPAQNTAPFNPGLQRAQRFVEVSWLTPEEESYCRAIPLRCLPAPTEKAVQSAAPPCKEWEAGRQGLAWVRQELDTQGRREQWLVGVADGNYDTQGIWKDLPRRTVLLVRCAKNRALYALPQPKEGGPGRPCSYGERLPAPRAYLQSKERKHLTPLTRVIRGKERRLPYRLVGPVLVEGAAAQPLFLLVVGGRWKKVGQRQYYRKPAYYLVNAVWQDEQWQLPFPVSQLLFWAWQRWECEVSHREMKSSLGIGKKQCWGPDSALSSVQWGMWVYALCVLAAYRTWGIAGGPRRQGLWYRRAARWSFAAMWQGYRAALWEMGEFRPLYALTLDKWLKKEVWLTGLGNALADASRI